MTEEIGDVDIIIKSLNEIQEDATVPSNVRLKIEAIVDTLRNNTELSIKVNKGLNELDEIASDVNLQAYTRTQIWNVMSLLEKL